MAIRKRTEEEKNRIIAEYQKSGKTAQNFCENLDLHHSTLGRWINKKKKETQSVFVEIGNQKYQKPFVVVPHNTAEKMVPLSIRGDHREEAFFRMRVSHRFILEIPLNAKADQLNAIFQAVGAL